jgi:hypothetical protein
LTGAIASFRGCFDTLAAGQRKRSSGMRRRARVEFQERSERIGADLISCRRAANTDRKMLFWKSWIDVAQFSFEAQARDRNASDVATGGQDGAAECTRMVMPRNGPVPCGRGRPMRIGEQSQSGSGERGGDTGLTGGQS